MHPAGRQTSPSSHIDRKDPAARSDTPPTLASRTRAYRRSLSRGLTSCRGRTGVRLRVECDLGNQASSQELTWPDTTHPRASVTTSPESLRRTTPGHLTESTKPPNLLEPVPPCTRRRSQLSPRRNIPTSQALRLVSAGLGVSQASSST